MGHREAHRRVDPLVLISQPSCVECGATLGCASRGCPVVINLLRPQIIRRPSLLLLYVAPYFSYECDPECPESMQRSACSGSAVQTRPQQST